MTTFRTISLPDIEGWFTPATCSKEFEGNILGHRQIKNNDGQMQDILIVKVIKPVSAMYEEKPVEIPEGGTLGVGIKFKLVDLLRYSDTGAHIRVKALSKVKLKGGNKWMWNYLVEVDSKVKPAPIRRRRPEDVDNSEYDGEEIPF